MPDHATSEHGTRLDSTRVHVTPDHAVSNRIRASRAAMAPFFRLFEASAYATRDPDDPENCDFVFGNPHEMPLEGFVTSLARGLTPQNQEWFAYKLSEPESQRIVAASLRERRGMPFESEDVLMTNGAFAALAVSLCALLDPGDEVIYVSPPWFFYEAMIIAYGGVPVRVDIDRATLDLDLDAIEAAITPRTKAIIINSPHNPTGKIYPPSTLEGLATLLENASERHGRPIYLLSDEAYSRILFDGRTYHSPTMAYPYSLLIYTYGKTLLTPGQRLGYIALPPTMPARAAMREALMAAQVVVGFAFPNALLQHSLADLEKLSIDIAALQRRRNLLVEALTAMGYGVRTPEATFYLMVDSPSRDDEAFAARLGVHKIYVLPGTIAELPGTFRVSLTANDAMIERSLAGFEAAYEEALATTSAPQPAAP
ncbi:MAG TPA: aminotransferase class I/II-fold pyridoxal phosphate-dependent enzyme [Trueperaceae bacterium]|nr:aminotransferase class I/II-fold pyridoxal phosphate-dependent enzyme [Trueperaceae bacterium]